jgi:hypothetical protein
MPAVYDDSGREEKVPHSIIQPAYRMPRVS